MNLRRQFFTCSFPGSNSRELHQSTISSWLKSIGVWLWANLFLIFERSLTLLNVDREIRPRQNAMRLHVLNESRSPFMSNKSRESLHLIKNLSRILIKTFSILESFLIKCKDSRDLFDIKGDLDSVSTCNRMAFCLG